jgi:hypothetical protein
LIFQNKIALEQAPALGAPGCDRADCFGDARGSGADHEEAGFLKADNSADFE